MGSLFENQSGIKDNTINLLLLVLWFGSLWGAVEALIGGLLHYILPPTIPGKFMIFMAIGIMAWSYKKTGKPWMPVAIALIAAPLKLFSAVVFQMPVNAPVILNPVFGILSQGLGFSLVALIVHKLTLPKSVKFLTAGAGAGATYSFIFAGLVAGVGLAVYPSMEVIKELGTKFPYWARSFSGLVSFGSTSLIYSVIAAGIGGFSVSFLPFKEYPKLKPGALASGSALWLTIFFVSSWLI